MDSLKNKVLELAEIFFPQVVTQRRHLHQYPELSFEEFETSKYITQQLDLIEIPYETGYVKTGIVALIKGKNPNKKTFALRGDMDALPIHENTGLDFASKNKGVMHACGHDVHTSCVLGAAAILNSLKDQFEGTIKLIFQPGEEVLPGGASLMIKEGALENPKPAGIVGQHVYPQFKSGTVGFRKGMYMASTDEIHLIVKGKGGHAAEPHLITNPILMASEIILEVQKINALGKEKNIPTIVSIGFVEGLGATNIVPDQVYIQGTFRTLNEEWRKEVHQKIRNICSDISSKYQGDVDTDIRNGYPYLENNPELTERVQNYAIELLGSENVRQLDLRMGGEDFSYYTHHIPGCFYRLGTSYPDQPSTGLHTSTFMVDEKALKTGISLLSWIALQELKH
ncbi:amidohydrolase [bacterium SCSIO 12643]|nr:amidohydrolase [bacterium SCSIO 12643]